MLQGAALESALMTQPVQPLNAIWLCRAVTVAALLNPNYPADTLFCDGAPRRGARFTPVGGPRSLYFGEDQETALAEVHQAYYDVMAIDPTATAPPPTVTYFAKVVLERVLDVTDPAVQAGLCLTPGELASSWQLFQAQGKLAPTQELGAAVHGTGYAQAIRYLSVPGTRRAGVAKHSYVIFCDLVRSPCFVEVRDPAGALAKRIP